MKRLLFTGDLMQHEKQLQTEASRDWSYTKTFTSLHSFLNEFDHVIGNLETTISTREPQGFPNFSAPLQFLDALKDAGFSTLVTCNNHSLDHNKIGHLMSMSHTVRKGFNIVGSFDTQRTVISKGINLHAATLISNKNDCAINNNGIVWYDESRFNRIPDEFNIAYLHGGKEYSTKPTQEQHDITDHLLYSKGFDVVLWAHSHVPGPVEILSSNDSKKFVCYGLGNFISDQTSLDRQIGQNIEIEISEDLRLINVAVHMTETIWDDSYSVVKLTSSKKLG